MPLFGTECTRWFPPLPLFGTKNRGEVTDIENRVDPLRGAAASNSCRGMTGTLNIEADIAADLRQTDWLMGKEEYRSKNSNLSL
jgi:hypothetical protein